MYHNKVNAEVYEIVELSGSKIDIKEICKNIK